MSKRNYQCQETPPKTMTDNVVSRENGRCEIAILTENDHEKDPIAPTQTGGPRVSYYNASEASKRRMRAEAKTAVHKLLDKCDEIMKGCGQHLLDDVVRKNTAKKH